MNYETQILESFERLGFAPRDNQVEYVDRIITAYLDEGFTRVILNAPTGCGKSLIGAVVADVMHSTVGKTDLASFILMGQNVLAKQYSDTFERDLVNDAMHFLFIKGANNYRCGALSTSTEFISAENCAKRIMLKNGLTEIVDEHCSGCEYDRLRKLKNKAKHLITNYSYFFVARMYGLQLERRTITVWDECHTLNDQFVEHNAIFFSDARLKSYAEELTKTLPTADIKPNAAFKRVREALVREEITANNYPTYLEILFDAYKAVASEAKALAERHSDDLAMHMKFKKLGKKYFNLGCKINDLIDYGYDHVFEFNIKDLSVTIKPVFVGEMFEVLNHSDYHLFMSATVTAKYMHRTISLDKERTKFISLPPAFPPSNKRVEFFAPLFLNQEALKKQATLDAVNARIDRIVDKHVAENHNGIILTPSFDLTRAVCDPLVWKKGVEVMEHKRGEKLAPLLEDFKNYRGRNPALLVSPSLFEGISLDNDLCRYQVIVKAPFASLGDKRIRYIRDNYPEIYQFATLLKILQGCGRGVRSADDWCVTYMLDELIRKLWMDSSNIWRGEFDAFFKRDVSDL